ncbi:MAG: TIGR03663 family protein, partial [Methanosarcina vacuolata]|nr:TIGR03663 family protein [Methanosarcina vacuolata]
MPIKKQLCWKIGGIMQRGRDYNTKNSPELSEKKYKILGFLIIFFALSIRLFDLGERVFHHDESVHASFTLRLLETGQYRYNPAYHGPFLFHSTAVVFHFLGINDTTARLIPVFFGIAAILLLFLLKKELGERGVLWSAFLLSFSPSMVYFSRFFRNDPIIVFCTLATVIGGIRYLENLHSPKRYPYLILTASSLAIAVSSKENAYLIILMFGAYAGIYSLYRFYSDWKKEKLSLKKTLVLKISAIFPFIPEVLLSGTLFILIVMLFYTSLFRTPETLFSIVERAFSHWMEMHRIERIGGPFYFYIPILLVYESPILIFGTAGIVHFLKKKGENASFFMFLSYWAVASLLLYSYLQEKVPWLVVHIVLPFGILAGAYLGDFFSRAPGRRQKNLLGTGNMNLSGTDKNPTFGTKSSRAHIF